MNDGVFSKIQKEGDPNFDPRLPFIKKDAEEKLINAAQQFNYSSDEEVEGILELIKEVAGDSQKYLLEYAATRKDFHEGNKAKHEMIKSKEKVLSSISQMQYLSQKLAAMSVYIM